MPAEQIRDQPLIHFLRTGPRRGVPLVFLHALGLDLSVWDEQIRHFGKNRDVIAIDLPGHGLSKNMAQKLGFEAFSRDILCLLSSLTPHPIDLVGISVGGMIAQTMAVLDPEKIRSLALVATSCTFPANIRQVLKERAEFARHDGMNALATLHLERWFPRKFGNARPEVLDRFRKLLLRQPDHFHAEMWDMVATLNLKDAISVLTCPVMVVAGEDDASASPIAGQVIVDQLPNGKLHVVPQCGHFPQIEHSNQFNELLSSFLADSDRQ